MSLYSVTSRVSGQPDIWPHLTEFSFLKVLFWLHFISCLTALGKSCSFLSIFFLTSICVHVLCLDCAENQAGRISQIPVLHF